MKILHYALGFPPYRTGGLTKYCMDLMLYEISCGHEVGLIWPGQIGFFSSGLRIRKGADYKKIKNYELINPLPVPLDEGIREITAYTKTGNKAFYQEFLRKIKPDLLHIHSLMGLHAELVEAASELGIRIVFTTHDYFGLCPKANLFKQGVACADDHECRDCVACNATALSIKKIRLLQSPLYRTMKDTAIVKKLRKRHRQAFSEAKLEENLQGPGPSSVSGEEYQRLRAYYQKIFTKFDLIHFNSQLTKEIYSRYIDTSKGQVIPITHLDIKRNKKHEKRQSEKLRLVYLGPAKQYKGYSVLVKALDGLWDFGQRDFELHMYQSVPECRPYMIAKANGYRYEELEAIFSEADVLIAPSICYETYGFTVLEALSFGTPVIVSDAVGAKDIIGEAGIIIRANHPEELKVTVDKLIRDKKKLEYMKAAAEQIKLPNMAKVTDTLEKLCSADIKRLNMRK